MEIHKEIELNEKSFQLDYTKNLSTAFLALRELQMDLKRETTDELWQELSRVDLMVQDVLHILEMVEFNASEGYKFAKMLQTIRRARRKIKDRMDERDAIKKLVDMYVKSGFKQQLEKMIVETENLQRKKEIRSYRLRELTELEGFKERIQKQKELLKETASY